MLHRQETYEDMKSSHKGSNILPLDVLPLFLSFTSSCPLPLFLLPLQRAADGRRRRKESCICMLLQ